MEHIISCAGASSELHIQSDCVSMSECATNKSSRGSHTHTHTHTHTCARSRVVGRDMNDGRSVAGLHEGVLRRQRERERLPANRP